MVSGPGEGPGDSGRRKCPQGSGEGNSDGRHEQRWERETQLFHQASVRNPLIAAETHLHQHGVHVLAGWDGVQVLLQVHGQKLKDEVQTGVVHQNFEQPRIYTILM